MAAIELTIEVPDIDLVMGQFSVIKVWKAADEEGPWVAITDTEDQTAYLESTAAEPFEVDGTSLILKVNNNPAVTISFVVPEFTAVAVVEAINNAMALEDQAPVVELSGDDADSFTLRANISGRESRVQVFECTAAEPLGLAVGVCEGLARHVPLYANINEYTFVDKGGDPEAWYRVTYHQPDDDTDSDPSDAFQGTPHVIATSEQLSTMSIVLMDLEGKPLSDVEIVFFPRAAISNHASGAVANPNGVRCITDGNGYAEIQLLRGIELRAVVLGTDFIRDFTVPDAETFDLLDVTADAPDLFEVVQSTKTFAVRRS